MEAELVVEEVGLTPWLWQTDSSCRTLRWEPFLTWCPRWSPMSYY